MAPANIATTSTGLNAALVYKRDAPGVVVVNATLARQERALGSGFVIDRTATSSRTPTSSPARGR